MQVSLAACVCLWWLIDDLLSSDLSRIHLASLSSDDFMLSLGTAQGHRLSVHLFNGLMRRLHDCISLHIRGVGVWDSFLARDCIRRAYSISPSALGPYSSAAVASCSNIKSRASDPAAVSAFISGWDSTATRLGIVDEAAPLSVVFSLYVDDAVAFASSSEQACSICRGAENFTGTYGSTFNVGPSKSAAMPIGDTFFDHELPGLALNGCSLPRTESYKHLGVLLDRHLLFVNQLNVILAKGRRTFEDFFGCASSLDLPFPVMASAVPLRVIANLRYGLEFVITVDGVETALNRLQVGWARSLLGLRGYQTGRWPF